MSTAVSREKLEAVIATLDFEEIRESHAAHVSWSEGRGTQPLSIDAWTNAALWEAWQAYDEQHEEETK